MTADFPDFQVPQANATAISTTGVPLLHAAVNQINIPSTNIAGAGSNTWGTLAMTQLGVDISVLLKFPAGLGTAPFGELRAIWSDVASGQLTWEDDYYMAGGNGAFAQYCLSLMAKGDQLQLILGNVETVQILTFACSVTQHSRPMTKDRAYEPQIAGVNGFNMPGGNPLTGEHASVSSAIGASNSITRLLPFSIGKHRMTLSNISGANGCNVSLADAVTGDLWGKWQVAAGASDTRDFNLPSSHALLTLTNIAAGSSITPAFASVREDY